MHRLRSLSVVVALAMIGMADIAYPCSAIRSTAALQSFQCFCPDGQEQEQQLPIYVGSGAISLSNRKSAPTLGSIVVEIQKRIGGSFTPVARRVLNEMNDAMVHTCLGSFTAEPPTGSIVLTDAGGHELSFNDVRDLPEGRVTIHYLATFAGVTNLALGDRVRVRVITTSIGAHGSGICTVDADGDGLNDADVKTLVFQKTVTVPALATLIASP